MDIQKQLQQGIAAAEAGRKAEARKLLTQVVEADENQLTAWLWLNQLVDSLEDKAVCLENILALDRDNQTAQAELAQVKSQQEALFRPAYLVEDENTASPPAETPLPPAPRLTEDEFDNEWLCPYCTTLTSPADKQCPHCHHPLVVSKRVQTERSVWLWRAIFLQFAIAFYLLALASAYYTLVIKRQGISNPLPFLPLYFGLPVEQPSAVVKTVLAVFPYWLFWGMLFIILYTLGLLLVLYFRTPYGNILYLINGGLILLGGSLSLVLLSTSWLTRIPSAIALLLGLLLLVIAFNLWNDFTFKTTRLRLRPDSGVKNHKTFYLSGRHYSELGMWGAAIIHLRRAVGRDPKNVEYRVALIIAYMNIRRYDLAENEIDELKKFAPHSIEAQRLADRLATLKKTAAPALP